MALTTVLLALGVFSLLNLTKALLSIRLLPAAKLLGALVFSSLGAAAFTSSVDEGALLAGAVFGLSTLFHVAHKLVGALGDHYRASTIRTLNR